MNKLLSFTILGGILLLSILLYGFLFNENNEASVQAEAPNRRDLYLAMREHGKMLLLHNLEGDKAIALLSKLKKGLSYQRRTKLEVNLRHESEVTKEELEQNPVYFIGDYANSFYLKKLTKNLPVKFESGAIRFDDKQYEASDMVFKFSLVPQSMNVSFPLYLITGNSNRAILGYLDYVLNENQRALYRSTWSYELLDNNQQLVFGALNDETWEMDKVTHFDFSSGHQVSVEGKHFRFTSYCPKWPRDRLNTLLEACNETLQDITDFVGMDPAPLNIKYSIYPSVENKGLRLNNSKQAHCDFTNGMVHVVANDYFSGNYMQKENEIILRKLLGQPTTMALEKGMAVYFTKNWQEKGYQYWANRLYRSKNLPPLRDLVDNQLLEVESEYVMNCSAGAMVNFLIDLWGKDQFLANYSDWEPSEKEIKKLEKAWLKFMNQQPSASGYTIPQKLPYLKGFNFAHEGYGIYNGYGSKMAGSSIERIKNIGGNAIAIVPYSYMENPNAPSFIPITQSAGSENDEAVVFAHAEAQKRGMKTVLKPQIWFGRGYWPGDVYMNNEEDWQQFFDYYHRWLRHYALIAEMYQFDGLCVGVEFAKATIARPDDWRALIQKLKQLYSGPVTYAANWGEEFENLSFWDELDYIGIDCYYPLSKLENPDKQELSQNFEKVMGKIAKVSKQYQKQVLFTEIGFRSVNQTWMQPHEEAKGRAVNQEAQQLCYEVVLESLQKQHWCNGILWWKWPSNLEGKDGENNRFTPFGKSAETTVENWFKKMTY